MYNLSRPSLSCQYCMLTAYCGQENDQQTNRSHKHFLIKQSRSLKRHEVLFLPKNKLHHLYIIQQGVLKTYQTEANGKELIRGFYFSGEILGYEAIHSGQHLFSAIALTEAVICEIQYDSFLQTFHAKQELQTTMLHLITQQLNARAYLLFSSAQQRIAAFLIDLSERLHHTETIICLRLPMSREDIGNYLRLTAETVSRIFSRLQKMKLIALDHKMITLIEPEKLREIAEGV